MVNLLLLDERLNQIRNSTNRLSKLQNVPLDEFLNNPDYYAISEHHLRRSLESLFDIGRHIIAKKGLGKPTTYSEIIEVLGQERIVPLEFCKKIKGMAGYRNRLVHEYASISPEEIYEIITTRIDDFALFCKYIFQYLELNK